MLSCFSQIFSQNSLIYLVCNRTYNLLYRKKECYKSARKSILQWYIRFSELLSFCSIYGKLQISKSRKHLEFFFEQKMSVKKFPLNQDIYFVVSLLTFLLYSVEGWCHHIFCNKRKIRKIKLKIKFWWDLDFFCGIQREMLKIVQCETAYTLFIQSFVKKMWDKLTTNNS